MIANTTAIKKTRKKNGELDYQIAKPSQDQCRRHAPTGGEVHGEREQDGEEVGADHGDVEQAVDDGVARC